LPLPLKDLADVRKVSKRERDESKHVAVCRAGIY
jgi:hypothetical protein